MGRKCFYCIFVHIHVMCAHIIMMCGVNHDICMLSFDHDDVHHVCFDY
jgi:hypothetical protein